MFIICTQNCLLMDSMSAALSLYLYRRLYSPHLLPHYPNHLISYFLLVRFPLALLLTPVSPLLRFEALRIWSCAQMFPSCECSAVSQVASWSRCSDVSLPPSVSAAVLSIQTPDCSDAFFFFLSREYPIHDLQAGCASIFLKMGDSAKHVQGTMVLVTFCHRCERIVDRNNLRERSSIWMHG